MAGLFQFIESGENVGGVFFNNWAFDGICTKVEEEAKKKGYFEIASRASQAPSLGFYSVPVESKDAVVLLNEAIVSAQKAPLVYGKLSEICEAYPTSAEYEESFFLQQAPKLAERIQEILEGRLQIDGA